MSTTMQMKEQLQLRLVSRWVVRGNIGARALPKTTFDVLCRLERFRLLVSQCYAVSLSPVVRDDWDVPNVKEFCDGILDRATVFHAWRSSLLQQHACRRTRVAVASSLFLFRKVLPSSLTKEEKKHKMASYVKKMCTPSPLLNPDFVEFAKCEIKNNFFMGWDKNWSRLAKSFTLPTSSCLESRRASGGARNLDRRLIRDEYWSFASGGKLDLGRDTTLTYVPTGGKDRLVSMFSYRRSFLKPLHTLLYDHLSKKKWLLRGEILPDSVSSFVPVKGEVFVSGDYESATDNLNIRLTALMLRTIRERCEFVPDSVWDAAEDSIFARFPNGETQKSGQLMGSLLSFPLLCLANYLTFKYNVRRPVPVLINGDDIVFRCRTNEREKWEKGVQESGLVLSRSKTLVHKSVFSLNSTFFISSKSNGPSIVPFIRSKCLFGAVEDAGEIAGRLRGCVCANGSIRDKVQTFLLDEIRPYLYSTQRSLRRGLGAKLSNRAIRWSRLSDREGFYLSLPSEPDVPMKQKAWMTNFVPEGYVKTYGVCDSPSFHDDMIETCWSRAPYAGKKVDDYWDYVREGTYRYVRFSASKFWSVIGGKGLPPAHNLQCRRPEKKWWIKQREGDVAFVSAGSCA